MSLVSLVPELVCLKNRSWSDSGTLILEMWTCQKDSIVNKCTWL